MGNKPGSHQAGTPSPSLSDNRAAGTGRRAISVTPTAPRSNDRAPPTSGTPLSPLVGTPKTPRLFPRLPKIKGDKSKRSGSVPAVVTTSSFSVPRFSLLSQTSGMTSGTSTTSSTTSLGTNDAPTPPVRTKPPSASQKASKDQKGAGGSKTAPTIASLVFASSMGSPFGSDRPGHERSAGYHGNNAQDNATDKQVLKTDGKESSPKTIDGKKDGLYAASEQGETVVLNSNQVLYQGARPKTAPMMSSMTSKGQNKTVASPVTDSPSPAMTPAGLASHQTNLTSGESCGNYTPAEGAKTLPTKNKLKDSELKVPSTLNVPSVNSLNGNNIYRSISQPLQLGKQSVSASSGPVTPSSPTDSEAKWSLSGAESIESFASVLSSASSLSSTSAKRGHYRPLTSVSALRDKQDKGRHEKKSFTLPAGLSLGSCSPGPKPVLGLSGSAHRINRPSPGHSRTDVSSARSMTSIASIPEVTPRSSGTYKPSAKDTGPHTAPTISKHIDNVSHKPTESITSNLQGPRSSVPDISERSAGPVVVSSTVMNDPVKSDSISRKPAPPTSAATFENKTEAESNLKAINVPSKTLNSAQKHPEQATSCDSVIVPTDNKVVAASSPTKFVPTSTSTGTTVGLKPKDSIKAKSGSVINNVAKVVSNNKVVATSETSTSGTSVSATTSPARTLPTNSVKATTLDVKLTSVGVPVTSVATMLSVNLPAASSTPRNSVGSSATSVAASCTSPTSATKVASAVTSVATKVTSSVKPTTSVANSQGPQTVTSMSTAFGSLKVTSISKPTLTSVTSESAPTLVTSESTLTAGTASKASKPAPSVGVSSVVNHPVTSVAVSSTSLAGKIGTGQAPVPKMKPVVNESAPVGEGRQTTVARRAEMKGTEQTSVGVVRSCNPSKVQEVQTPSRGSPGTMDPVQAKAQGGQVNISNAGKASCSPAVGLTDKPSTPPHASIGQAAACTGEGLDREGLKQQLQLTGAHVYADVNSRLSGEGGGAHSTCTLSTWTPASETTASGQTSSTKLQDEQGDPLPDNGLTMGTIETKYKEEDDGTGQRAVAKVAANALSPAARRRLRHQQQQTLKDAISASKDNATKDALPKSKVESGETGGKGATCNILGSDYLKQTPTDATNGEATASGDVAERKSESGSGQQFMDKSAISENISSTADSLNADINTKDNSSTSPLALVQVVTNIKETREPNTSQTQEPPADNSVQSSTGPSQPCNIACQAVTSSSIEGLRSSCSSAKEDIIGKSTQGQNSQESNIQKDIASTVSTFRDSSSLQSSDLQKVGNISKSELQSDSNGLVTNTDRDKPGINNSKDLNHLDNSGDCGIPCGKQQEQVSPCDKGASITGGGHAPAKQSEANAANTCVDNGDYIQTAGKTQGNLASEGINSNGVGPQRGEGSQGKVIEEKDFEKKLADSNESRIDADRLHCSGGTAGLVAAGSRSTPESKEGLTTPSCAPHKGQVATVVSEGLTSGPGVVSPHISPGGTSGFGKHPIDNHREGVSDALHSSSPQQQLQQQQKAVGATQIYNSTSTSTCTPTPTQDLGLNPACKYTPNDDSDISNVNPQLPNNSGVNSNVTATPDVSCSSQDVGSKAVTLNTPASLNDSLPAPETTLKKSSAQVNSVEKEKLQQHGGCSPYQSDDRNSPSWICGQLPEPASSDLPSSAAAKIIESHQEGLAQGGSLLPESSHCITSSTVTSTVTSPTTSATSQTAAAAPTSSGSSEASPSSQPSSSSRNSSSPGIPEHREVDCDKLSSAIVANSSPGSEPTQQLHSESSSPPLNTLCVNQGNRGDCTTQLGGYVNHLSAELPTHSMGAADSKDQAKAAPPTSTTSPAPKDNARPQGQVGVTSAPRRITRDANENKVGLPQDGEVGLINQTASQSFKASDHSLLNTSQEFLSCSSSEESLQANTTEAGVTPCKGQQEGAEGSQFAKDRGTEGSAAVATGVCRQESIDSDEDMSGLRSKSGGQKQRPVMRARPGQPRGTPPTSPVDPGSSPSSGTASPTSSTFFAAPRCVTVRQRSVDSPVASKGPTSGSTTVTGTVPDMNSRRTSIPNSAAGSAVGSAAKVTHVLRRTSVPGGQSVTSPQGMPGSGTVTTVNMQGVGSTNTVTNVPPNVSTPLSVSVTRKDVPASVMSPSSRVMNSPRGPGDHDMSSIASANKAYLSDGADSLDSLVHRNHDSDLSTPSALSPVSDIQGPYSPVQSRSYTDGVEGPFQAVAKPYERRDSQGQIVQGQGRQQTQAGQVAMANAGKVQSGAPVQTSVSNNQGVVRPPLSAVASAQAVNQQGQPPSVIQPVNSAAVRPTGPAAFRPVGAQPPGGQQVRPVAQSQQAVRPVGQSTGQQVVQQQGVRPPGQQVVQQVRPTAQQQCVRPTGPQGSQQVIRPTGQQATGQSRQQVMQQQVRPAGQQVAPTGQQAGQQVVRPSGQQVATQPGIRPTVVAQAGTSPTGQPVARPTGQQAPQQVRPNVQQSAQIRPTGQHAGPQMAQQIRPVGQQIAPQTVQQVRLGSQQAVQQPTQQIRPAVQQAAQVRPAGQPVAQQSVTPTGQPVVRPTGQQVAQARPTGPQTVQQVRPAGQQVAQQNVSPTGQPMVRPVGQQMTQARPTGPQAAQQQVRPAVQQNTAQSVNSTGQPVVRPTVQQVPQQIRPAGQQVVQVRPTGQVAQPGVTPTVQPAVRPSGQQISQSGVRPQGPTATQPAQQVVRPAGQPVPQAVTRPAGQPVPQAVTRPAGQQVPIQQVVSQPTQPGQAMVRPVTQQTTTPTITPVIQPVTAPSTQPIVKPVAQANATVPSTTQKTGQVASTTNTSTTPMTGQVTSTKNTSAEVSVSNTAISASPHPSSAAVAGPCVAAQNQSPPDTRATKQAENQKEIPKQPPADNSSTTGLIGGDKGTDTKHAPVIANTTKSDGPAVQNGEVKGKKQHEASESESESEDYEDAEDDKKAADKEKTSESESETSDSESDSSESEGDKNKTKSKEKDNEMTKDSKDKLLKNGTINHRKIEDFNGFGQARTNGVLESTSCDSGKESKSESEAKTTTSESESRPGRRKKRKVKMVDKATNTLTTTGTQCPEFRSVGIYVSFDEEYNSDDDAGNITSSTSASDNEEDEWSPYDESDYVEVDDDDDDDKYGGGACGGGSPGPDEGNGGASGERRGSTFVYSPYRGYHYGGGNVASLGPNDEGLDGLIARPNKLVPYSNGSLHSHDLENLRGEVSEKDVVGKPGDTHVTMDTIVINIAQAPPIAEYNLTPSELKISDGIHDKRIDIPQMPHSSITACHTGLRDVPSICARDITPEKLRSNNNNNPGAGVNRYQGQMSMSSISCNGTHMQRGTRRCLYEDLCKDIYSSNVEDQTMSGTRSCQEVRGVTYGCQRVMKQGNMHGSHDGNLHAGCDKPPQVMLSQQTRIKTGYNPKGKGDDEAKKCKANALSYLYLKSLACSTSESEDEMSDKNDVDSVKKEIKSQHRKKGRRLPRSATLTSDLSNGFQKAKGHSLTCRNVKHPGEQETGQQPSAQGNCKKCLAAHTCRNSQNSITQRLCRVHQEMGLLLYNASSKDKCCLDNMTRQKIDDLGAGNHENDEVVSKRKVHGVDIFESYKRVMGSDLICSQGCGNLPRGVDPRINAEKSEVLKSLNQCLTHQALGAHSDKIHWKTQCNTMGQEETKVADAEEVMGDGEASDVDIGPHPQQQVAPVVRNQQGIQMVTDEAMTGHTPQEEKQSEPPQPPGPINSPPDYGADMRGVEATTGSSSAPDMHPTRHCTRHSGSHSLALSGQSERSSASEAEKELSTKDLFISPTGKTSLQRLQEIQSAGSHCMSDSDCCDMDPHKDFDVVDPTADSGIDLVTSGGEEEDPGDLSPLSDTPDVAKDAPDAPEHPPLRPTVSEKGSGPMYASMHHLHTSDELGGTENVAKSFESHTDTHLCHLDKTTVSEVSDIIVPTAKEDSNLETLESTLEGYTNHPLDYNNIKNTPKQLKTLDLLTEGCYLQPSADQRDLLIGVATLEQPQEHWGVQEESTPPRGTEEERTVPPEGESIGTPVDQVDQVDQGNTVHPETSNVPSPENREVTEKGQEDLGSSLETKRPVKTKKMDGTSSEEEFADCEEELTSGHQKSDAAAAGASDEPKAAVGPGEKGGETQGVSVGGEVTHDEIAAAAAATQSPVDQQLVNAAERATTQPPTDTQGPASDLPPENKAPETSNQVTDNQPPPATGPESAQVVTSDPQPEMKVSETNNQQPAENKLPPSNQAPPDPSPPASDLPAENKLPETTNQQPVDSPPKATNQTPVDTSATSDASHADDAVSKLSAAGSQPTSDTNSAKDQPVADRIPPTDVPDCEKSPVSDQAEAFDTASTDTDSQPTIDQPADIDHVKAFDKVDAPADNQPTIDQPTVVNTNIEPSAKEPSAGPLPGGDQKSGNQMQVSDTASMSVVDNKTESLQSTEAVGDRKQSTESRNEVGGGNKQSPVSGNEVGESDSRVINKPGQGESDPQYGLGSQSEVNNNETEREAKINRTSEKRSTTTESPVGIAVSEHSERTPTTCANISADSADPLVSSQQGQQNERDKMPVKQKGTPGSKKKTAKGSKPKDIPQRTPDNEVPPEEDIPLPKGAYNLDFLDDLDTGFNPFQTKVKLGNSPTSGGTFDPFKSSGGIANSPPKGEDFNPFQSKSRMASSPTRDIEAGRGQQSESRPPQSDSTPVESESAVLDDDDDEPWPDPPPEVTFQTPARPKPEGETQLENQSEPSENEVLPAELNTGESAAESNAPVEPITENNAPVQPIAENNAPVEPVAENKVPIEPIAENQPLSVSQETPTAVHQESPETADPLQDLRQLDEEENWRERASIITKEDHSSYVDTAQDIVQEIVDDLPIKSPVKQTEETSAPEEKSIKEAAATPTKGDETFEDEFVDAEESLGLSEERSLAPAPVEPEVTSGEVLPPPPSGDKDANDTAAPTSLGGTDDNSKEDAKDIPSAIAQVESVDNNTKSEVITDVQTSPVADNAVLAEPPAAETKAVDQKVTPSTESQPEPDIVSEMEPVAMETEDQAPPSSPPLPARGSYNFNFDEFDENTNPFASKGKLGSSPPKNLNGDLSSANPFQSKSKMGRSPPGSPKVVRANTEDNAQPEPPVDNSQNTSPSETTTSPSTPTAKTPVRKTPKKKEGPGSSAKKTIPKRQKFRPPSVVKKDDADDEIQIFAPGSNNNKTEAVNAEDIEILMPPSKGRSEQTLESEKGISNSQESAMSISDSGPLAERPNVNQVAEEETTEKFAEDLPQTRSPADRQVPGEDDFQPASSEMFNDSAAWDMLDKFGGEGDDFKASALSRQSLYVKFDPLIKGQSPVNRGAKGQLPTIPAAVQGEGNDLLLMSTPPQKNVEPKTQKTPTSKVKNQQKGAAAEVDRLLNDSLLTGSHEQQQEMVGSREQACTESMYSSSLCHSWLDSVNHYNELDPTAPTFMSQSSMEGSAFWDPGSEQPPSNPQPESAAKTKVQAMQSSDKMAVLEIDDGTDGIIQVLKYSQSDVNRMMKENEMEHRVKLHEEIEKRDKSIGCLEEVIRGMRMQEEAMFEALKKAKADRDTENSSAHKLIQERDVAVEDLKAVEEAFAHLHQRYEKSKQALEGHKKNEEVLKKCILDYQDKLKQQLEKYERLRKECEQKLQMANDEIEKLKKTSESQMTLIQAALRKAEIKNSSLESNLEQKTKENKELTAICDELFAKVGDS